MTTSAVAVLLLRVLAGLWLTSNHVATAFYLPGVHPETFPKGEEVPLKVNALTSTKTQIPRDYYRLPFCQPDGGPNMASENLGEFLTGNKIQSSPYIINMLHDVYCQKVRRNERMIKLLSYYYSTNAP